jgi:hypothetical protein
VAIVVAGLTMSLDGYIAHLDDSVEHLFDWYDNGDVEVRWPGNDMVSRVTPASAAYLRDTIAGAGALVVGRAPTRWPRLGPGSTCRRRWVPAPRSPGPRVR